MKVLEGKLVAEGIKVGIVAARFNEFIVSKLVSGALDGLKRHGVSEEDISIAWVPGAFEIPLVAKKMAESPKYDVVICLGAVIKGSTPHFDYVCAFGILTTNSIEEAIERAGTKAGNKGYDAAVTAIEMANLMKLF